MKAKKKEEMGKIKKKKFFLSTKTNLSTQRKKKFFFKFKN